MPHRWTEHAHGAVHVASTLMVIAETGFLVVTAPFLPFVVLVHAFMHPFVDAMGREDLSANVIVLSPLILYGLVSVWWMVRRGSPVRFDAIPVAVLVGLFCRGVACAMLVGAWASALWSEARVLSGESHAIGIWALLALLVLGVQSRLIFRELRPQADDATPDALPPRRD
ncbi:MAG: hypothetical protein R3298_02860 [Gammaproteobacteria bacterium]|nr:hypothetical protein [Gammaproteobacteria bacterium]